MLSSITTMCLTKRSRGDDDEQRQTKMPRLEDSLHPYYLLEYLVKTVIPNRCRNEDVRAFFQAQLDDPDAAIDQCKSLLSSWILEMYEEGTLYKYEEYVLLCRY